MIFLGMGSYFAIMTCRNSEKLVKSAILSLLTQIVPPKYIIVVNDGSTDNTQTILQQIKADHDNLYIITHPDLGYDITRVVKNWNEALRIVKDSNLDKTDYHMIATDDTVYPKDYTSKMISFLDSHSEIVISSGQHGKERSIFPHGAGRFVRNSFFHETRWNGFYPEKMGYETAILYEALRCNYNFHVLNDLKFEHNRPLGTNHKFYTFGASMVTLGYHPFYVYARFVKNIITGKETGKIGAFFMLYHYLKFKPNRSGFDSLFDKETREFIRKIQKKKLENLLVGKLTFNKLSLFR